MEEVMLYEEIVSTFKLKKRLFNIYHRAVSFLYFLVVAFDIYLVYQFGVGSKSKKDLGFWLVEFYHEIGVSILGDPFAAITILIFDIIGSCLFIIAKVSKLENLLITFALIKEMFVFLVYIVVCPLTVSKTELFYSMIQNGDKKVKVYGMLFDKYDFRFYSILFLISFFILRSVTLYLVAKVLKLSLYIKGMTIHLQKVESLTEEILTNENVPPDYLSDMTDEIPPPNYEAKKSD